MNYYKRITEALSGASKAYRKLYTNVSSGKKDNLVNRVKLQRLQGSVPQSGARKIARRGQTGHWTDRRTKEVRASRLKKHFGDHPPVW